MSKQVVSPHDRLERAVAIASRSLRFWWIGALVIVLGTAAATGAATLRKRAYRSETVLLYREGIRTSYVLGRDAETEAARKLGLRLKEMVLSRPRLETMVKELGIYQDVADAHGYVVAVDKMRGGIEFKVREGDTFLLSFTAPTPELAQQVAERLADALVAENARYRTEQVEVTRQFLVQETKRAEDELKLQEAALAGFLARHPEFAEDQFGQGGAAVRAADQKKKAGGNTSAEELALVREANRIRQRLALPTGERAKPPKGQVDPRLAQDVADAEAELTAARRDLADKQGRLTDQHPDVVAAKNRVKSAEARAKRTKDALASGELVIPEVEAPPASEAERPALEARLEQVEIELAAVRRRQEIAGSPAAKSGLSEQIAALEAEVARLDRELIEARERYQQIEGRQFVAEIAASTEESGQAAQMVVVDPAFVPTRPVGGGRMKFVVLGFLASCALAGALVLGCGLFDDRLYDKTDVELLEIAPLLATVPRPPGRFFGRSDHRG
jgi:uncharacterized protein involved in exopolysaccharide biosynthesis